MSSTLLSVLVFILLPIQMIRGFGTATRGGGFGVVGPVHHHHQQQQHRRRIHHPCLGLLQRRQRSQLSLLLPSSSDKNYGDNQRAGYNTNYHCYLSKYFIRSLPTSLLLTRATKTNTVASAASASLQSNRNGCDDRFFCSSVRLYCSSSSYSSSRKGRRQEHQEHQQQSTTTKNSAFRKQKELDDDYNIDFPTIHNCSNNNKEIQDFLGGVEDSLCRVILPFAINSNNDNIKSRIRKESAVSATSSSMSSSSVLQPRQSPPSKIPILVVGVSGGCDSMGLLHALLDISTTTGNEKIDDGDDHVQLLTNNKRRFRDGQIVELHVVHFNHCQRGLESDLDCQLVQEICQQQGVSCHVFTWEEEQHNSSNKNNNKKKKAFSQAKARQWRQSTMTRLLRDLTTTTSTATEQSNNNNNNNDDDDDEKRPGLILTAHHANDSQETLLLKLLRGVHVQNLSGMEQIQPMEDDNDINGINDINHNNHNNHNHNHKPTTTRTAIWARPLLHTSKNDIRRYLTFQNYQWREDASNQSSKYLRNRVRNELVPLLEELVGGETALQKRLDNLEEQCRDIRNDMTKRIDPILLRNNAHVLGAGGAAAADNSDDDQRVENRFLLLAKNNDDDDNNNNNYFQVDDLVTRHALYDWVTTSTKKHQFSYHVWKNVLAQLRDYPQNRQWKLPLGEGWHITRLGDALQVDYGDGNSDQQQGNNNNNTGIVPLTAAATTTVTTTTNPEEKLIDWSYSHDDDGDTLKGCGVHSTDTCFLVVSIPPPFRIAHQTKCDLDNDDEYDDDNNNNTSLEFVKSTAGAFDALSWKFTPPWREGRSPTKLGSFLRGQKVLLHLRSMIPILVCRHHTRHCDDHHDNDDAGAEATQTTTAATSSTTLVAVLVNDKWIVDSAWKINKDGCNSIALTLQR